MHNEMRYTQSDSFRPDEAGPVIAHYVVNHIISQANEPDGQDLTDENVVLYFNGMVPMIKGLPILCFYPKPLKGDRFMAAFPSVALVVLRCANLGKYSCVSATWMTRVLSISAD